MAKQPGQYTIPPTPRAALELAGAQVDQDPVHPQARRAAEDLALSYSRQTLELALAILRRRARLA